MSTCGGFFLMIPGKPEGKQRARHGQGRTFTPRQTVLAEQEIRRAWQEAGEPRIDGPVKVIVTLAVCRPASHYKTSGSLSAEGLRRPVPDRQKPDVDNALKLVLDSLNTRAWPDDVRIVDAHVYRCWAPVAYTSVKATVHTTPTDSVVPSASPDPITATDPTASTGHREAA